ncbi:MAG TPA: hypothetical protein VIL69_07995 [Roseomonas sp.]
MSEAEVAEAELVWLFTQQDDAVAKWAGIDVGNALRDLERALDALAVGRQSHSEVCGTRQPTPGHVPA